MCSACRLCGYKPVRLAGIFIYLLYTIEVDFLKKYYHKWFRSSGSWKPVTVVRQDTNSATKVSYLQSYRMKNIYFIYLKKYIH